MKIKAIINRNNEGFFQVWSTIPEFIWGDGMSEAEAKDSYLECFEEQVEAAVEKDGKRPEWADAEVEFVFNYNMKVVHRMNACQLHEQNGVFVRLKVALENSKGSVSESETEVLSVKFVPQVNAWTRLMLYLKDIEGLEVRLSENPSEAIGQIRTWLKDLCDEDNGVCSTLIEGADHNILLYYEDDFCAANEGAEVDGRQGTFVVLTDHEEEPVFMLHCMRIDLIRTVYEAVVSFLEEMCPTEDSAKKWGISLFGGNVSLEFFRHYPDSPVEDFQSETIEDAIY